MGGLTLAACMVDQVNKSMCLLFYPFLQPQCAYIDASVPASVYIMQVCISVPQLYAYVLSFHVLLAPGLEVTKSSQ
jgi:hypothetical protein